MGISFFFLFSFFGSTLMENILLNRFRSVQISDNCYKIMSEYNDFKRQV